MIGCGNNVDGATLHATFERLVSCVNVGDKLRTRFVQLLHGNRRLSIPWFASCDQNRKTSFSTHTGQLVQHVVIDKLHRCGGMEYEKPGVGYGVRTGVSFPRRMFSSVDLPTPFGPTIATRQTDRQTDRKRER